MARLTPDDTMPCTQSTLSWSTSLRSRSMESLGLVSSSTMSSTLRPAMPPAALIRATANSVPLRPHSPMVPAMPALGAMMPILSGVFCENAGAPMYDVAAAAPMACRICRRFRFILSPPLDVRGVAGELLDHVQQLIRCPCRLVLVAGGDGARDVGVQLRGERHVGGLLVVDVPEAARERVHEAHRAGGELVVRGRAAERVELAVGAHEGHVVVHLGGALELRGELAEARTLGIGRAARGGAGDEALE